MDHLLTDPGAWVLARDTAGPFTTIASCAFEGTFDPDESLARHLASIDAAADAGADLVVFPEISLQGYPSEVKRDARRLPEVYASAERVPDGPRVRRLLDAAAARGLYVVFGVTEAGDRAGVVYNTAVLGGPKGYLGRFRKCHVTLGEQIVYRTGTDWPVFPTRFGKLGILICYDLHWPEAARELMLRGADVLVAPKAWPGGEMYDAHQLLFESVRALENSRWLVSANYAGTLGGAAYPGDSRIIDPLGRVVATTGSEPGLAIATVDLGAGFEDAASVYNGSRQVRDRQSATYRALRGELDPAVDG
jgi:predicted amidohydrolase